MFDFRQQRVDVLLGNFEIGIIAGFEVNIGDEVTVRVVEVDRMGRINLTMRPEDMTADLEKLTRPERRERSDRPERRDDRRGGRRDDRRERSEKKEDNE